MKPATAAQRKLLDAIKGGARLKIVAVVKGSRRWTLDGNTIHAGTPDACKHAFWIRPAVPGSWIYVLTITGENQCSPSSSRQP